jgi:hypothetical protein
MRGYLFRDPMDDRTEELRDLFVETTGADTVTERQEDARGSLTDREDAEERVRAVVARMRERYAFATDLDDDALVGVARAFFEGRDDAAIAEDLDVDETAVVRARFDLHLVDDADREPPAGVDLAALRRRVVAGDDLNAAAAALDADPGALSTAYRAAVADVASRRANGRFRDEFADLLADADLSTRLASDAREDGLREATEDIETDVSF